MCEEIPKKHKNKCNMKGIVKNWKNCDDIWIFYAENVYIRTESESLTSERLKIVACDTQIRSYYEGGKKTQKKDANEDGA